jgi:hypothetical protein
MRIGELLSLRLNYVTFDDETGTAKLQLRHELTASHGLKTGARYVIIGGFTLHPRKPIDGRASPIKR